MHHFFTSRCRAVLPMLGLWLCATVEGCNKQQPTDPAQPPATVGPIKGPVSRVTSDEQPQGHPCLTGEALALGDTVVTGADGQADVVFAGNVVVHLGANCQLLVRSADGGTSSEVGAVLLSGEARAQAPAGAGALKLSTPLGVVHIGGPKLTVLDVSIDHGLKVVTGDVGISSSITAPVTELHAGQKMDVAGLEVGLGSREVSGLSLAVHKEQPLLAVVLTRSGKQTRVRNKGSSLWRSPKANTALHPGDVLEVPITQKASVKLGDTMWMRLSNGASWTLDEANDAQDGPNVSSTLRGGSAAITIGPPLKGSRQTIKAADANLIVTSTLRQASVDLQHNGDQAQIYVRFGQLKIGDDVITAGHVAQVQAGKLVTAPHQAFADAITALPSRRTLVFFDGAKPPISFSWQKTTSVTEVGQAGEKDRPNAFELATDAQFAALVGAENVAENRFALDRLPLGRTFWRAADQGGELILLPDAQKICRGCGGETVLDDTGEASVISYQQLEPQLILRWAKSYGVKNWRVRLYGTADLNHPTIDQMVSANYYALQPGALEVGSYLWNVLPADETTTKVDIAKMNKFELVHDAVVVGADIEMPRRGTKVQSRSLISRGTVEPKSLLTINGKAVALDKEGRFSHQVELELGKNQLIYHVVSRGSIDRYYLRDVVRVSSSR